MLLSSGDAGRLTKAVRAVLDDIGAEVHEQPADEARYAALIFDASGAASVADLRGLYDFFHPVLRSLRPSGRLIVLGTPPTETDDANEAVVQRALEGFTRSAGKEQKRGATGMS